VWRGHRSTGYDQGYGKGLAGLPLPCGRSAENGPEACCGSFAMVGEGVFPHRSRFPVEGRSCGQGIPRAEKPA
jgi:hypothetical protein